MPATVNILPAARLAPRRACIRFYILVYVRFSSAGSTYSSVPLPALSLIYLTEQFCLNRHVTWR